MKTIILVKIKIKILNPRDCSKLKNPISKIFRKFNIKMYKIICSQNSYDEEDEHKQWEEEQSQIKNPEYLRKYFEKQKVNKPKSPSCKLNNEDGHSLLDGNLQLENENDKNEADNDQNEESGEGEEYGSFFKGIDGDCKSEDWSGEQMKKINVTVNPTVSLPVPKTDQLSPKHNIVPPVPEQKLSENKDSEDKVDNPHAESGSTSNSRRRDVWIKSILRSMRRYYCEKLENETIYVRKEKRIKFKHQLLIKWSYEIITKLGLDGFSENMAFYFALFSYSWDMRKILEKLKINHGYLKGPWTCGNVESW